MISCAPTTFILAFAYLMHFFITPQDGVSVKLAKIVQIRLDRSSWKINFM